MSSFALRPARPEDFSQIAVIFNHYIESSLATFRTERVDRAALLTALPGWRWTPTQDRWQEGLDALTTYVSRYGAATPGRGDTVAGYPLGAWVNTQKSAHKAGRLSADRAAKLAALPGWRWRT